ncbi:MAG: 50S ribosomal protein L18 [Peptococcaceae bacterium]|nr:50S ribosomal protein L18 [Peptococcaceae bacterium]
MINKPDRKELRNKRRVRVRKKIFGTGERPRLNVFRSLNNIYASLIDDEKGVTLLTVSTLSPDLKGKLASGGNKEAAASVGSLIARAALEKGIKKVVFDRAGYLYHGRVKALADAAREGGLEF